MKDKLSSDIPFYLPPPLPSPAYTVPLPLDQHRTYESFPCNLTIHTPLIQLIDLDLLSNLPIPNIKKSVNSYKKDKLTTQLHIQTDKEVLFDVFVKDSFKYIDDEIKHPHDESLLVAEVIELLPYCEGNKESVTDFIAVVDDGKTNFCVNGFECDFRLKVPSKVLMDGNEYAVMANDISDYLCVHINGDKAYFREIGVCLKLKKK